MKFQGNYTLKKVDHLIRKKNRQVDTKYGTILVAHGKECQKSKNSN